MTSHFSSIGFPVSTTGDLADLAQRVAEDTQDHEVHAGRYLQWADASGAELWLQVDPDDELIGMAPHFRGPARLDVGLTARVHRDDDTVLDGAFHGWADPEGEVADSGLYPFVFDAPDFRRHASLSTPAVVAVQVAAFAHEVRLFASLAAFEDSERDVVRFASQAFVPSGLFGVTSAAGPPEALALITGHVVATERKQNALSRRWFRWALVESLGGPFDVVIDEDLLTDAPTVGGVVQGSFWLSGRIESGY